MLKAVLISFIIVLVKCDNNNLRIPKGFLIGTASSSYQTEGAWNVSDKGISNWDNYCHTYPERIIDHSTGDVASDTYHNYEEDADILKNLGVDYYRFSMSWPRILPFGHARYVSKSGLNHYHKVLDSLEKRGITPFVTIYHLDHPQILDEFGGWLNESMIYLFADYARTIFSEFGHRVKFFTTMNEPGLYCTLAYRNASFLFPPSLNLTGTGDYKCLHNMLKGHALAYHIYDKEFRHKYNGQVGLIVQCNTPYSKHANDSTSADISFEFECGWQTHPIFSKTGDYPEIIKQRIAERSKIQGFPSTRLPTFSSLWIKLLKGSSDYFGLNHYTSRLVDPLPKSSIKDWPNDEGLTHSFDPSWPSTDSDWLKINPKGLRDLLNIIKNKYGNPPVYITENGASDGNGTNDTIRMGFLYSYMKEVITAVKQDKCNVKSYTIWSFLDSYEWTRGYAERFGIIDVNFNHENRTRTLKRSAIWLKGVISTRNLYSADFKKFL